MTYIKKVEEEACPTYWIVECNKCSSQFWQGDPHIQYDEVHICEECIFALAEEYIDYNIGGWKLFWLKEMEEKYFSKIKRKPDRYLSKKLRKEILIKYKYLCVYCGGDEHLAIDHIHPVSKGGGNEASNLQVACRSCNSKKGNKLDYGKD